MNKNTISNKIKILGGLISIFILTVLMTVIHLNDKNKKDALMINIVGKERMLTQQISKNIFYLYQAEKKDFTELNLASSEFIYNLHTLKYGNKNLAIVQTPTENIKKQIFKVEGLWNVFFKEINLFKKTIIKNDEKSKLTSKKTMQIIYNSNNQILEEVDILVSLYTSYAEKKSNYVKKFQYSSTLLILLLLAYSFSQLKAIEENAKKFLAFSKKIAKDSDLNTHLEKLNIDGEKEFVEAADTINCFVNKVNKAMDYSALAITQSKNAGLKLEEITDEFSKILSDLNNKSEISKQLNKSEDMVIDTTEGLITSSKKLEELKNELDKLLIIYNSKK